MEFWRNKIAIVTGAGQGIGAKIAEDLVRFGVTVIGFECTEETVDIMLSNVSRWGRLRGQLVPCKCDISKDNELRHAFETIVTAYGGVDLLINNAAAGFAGYISTGDVENMKTVTDVNIYGLIACTRLAIKSMIQKNGKGCVVNINSICGHYYPNFAEPTTNMYVASKQAMTAFNDVLRNEVKSQKLNISVISVSPGLVRSGLFKRAGIDFINDEFFEKNPHLTVDDVSKIVFMVLAAPPTLKIKEVIFHALNEIY